MTVTHEAQRVAELHRYADPDADPGPEVDDLVCLAAEVGGVPMSTLNLLDSERQCQVSTEGFEGSTTPRREAMCNVTVELGTFVHVPDVRVDPRFADSPWVDGRRADVRFYAAAPLVSRAGHVLGTLCVFDVQPHLLDPAQVDRLEGLAERLTALLTTGEPVTS